MRDIISGTIIFPLALMLYSLTIWGQLIAYASLMTDAIYASRTSYVRLDKPVIFGHEEHSPYSERIADAELNHLNCELARTLKNLLTDSSDEGGE